MLRELSFAMICAGLTIGLMALDEVSLEVIKNSGTETQRKYATRIAPIRKDGYMLLITLLLASTVTPFLCMTP